MEIVFVICTMALGFTPDALPSATLTIYPALGPALFNTNLCSPVAGLLPLIAIRFLNGPFDKLIAESW